ncbi:probable G-protein coupled receptor Mth-like 14 [Anopheles ziemanni]|uniref:probable G-protein coupled receptor Mth-like 14 n=1 Tax=Anopheles coustani TaxID=139045 RepID=UPI002659B499|nr:probable G-protein coupled receptor Mth-like 14 [Anopheles coustani]XP_058176305.1 probable G-protein coupled receptor Mth-like 14 [Anopheles ziemanni]
MVNAAQLEGSGQGYNDKNGQDIVSGSPVHAGERSSVVPKPNVSVSGTPENATGGVQQIVAAVKQTTVGFGEDVEAAVENIYTNMTTFDGVMPIENVTDCTGYQVLADQPVYIGPSVNFIRKCCPQGQRMVHDGDNIISCQPEGPQTNRSTMSTIVAKFYDGCIEDLEEDAALGFIYGNPCVTERGLVSYGPHFMDTLYVIQNGSLLVIYKRPYNIEVFNSYCLDYRISDATIVAYVCPEEVSLGADFLPCQLILLTVCLIFAIPLLLLTAFFYMIIPELHDLHGKALAMNCVNFAFALLLESFFQHKASGKRMNADQIVLKNSAEYLILATFFWLLVNCANNCFHAWTNYTALLFVVMAIVWVFMTASYYSTYKLPIFYDILFGLQGIVMFIIFICLPKPRDTTLYTAP